MPESYGWANQQTDGWMDEWLSVMVTPGESLTYRTGGCLAIVLNVAVVAPVAVSVTIDALCPTPAPVDGYTFTGSLRPYINYIRYHMNN